MSDSPPGTVIYIILFLSNQDLSGVGRRFEHQLTADAHHLADATSVGSKIICCYTLGNYQSCFGVITN